MITGLQVLNSTGDIQIDEKYFNSALVSRGSFANYSAIPIPPSPNECFLAMIRPLGYGLWVSPVSPNTNPNPSYLYSVSGLSGEYAVFNTKATPIREPGNIGLQVYNPSGALVFDSSCTYPRITSVLSRGIPTTWDYPYIINVPPMSGIPWFSAADLRVRYGAEDMEPTGIHVRVLNSTQIEVDCRIMGNPDAPSVNTYYAGWSASEKLNLFDPYQGVQTNIKVSSFI